MEYKSIKTCLVEIHVQVFSMNLGLSMFGLIDVARVRFRKSSDLLLRSNFKSHEIRLYAMSE